MSNSWFHESGLYEFDPDGRKARALERAIGIKVIRHSRCLSLRLSFSYDTRTLLPTVLFNNLVGGVFRPNSISLLKMCVYIHMLNYIYHQFLSKLYLLMLYCFSIWSVGVQG